jgi:hypothetical protein
MCVPATLHNDCIGSACATYNPPVTQTYTDSADPLGTPGNAATYNLTMAQDACAAYTGNPSQCGTSACGATNVVCNFTSPQPNCACWTWNGAGAGTVIVSTTILMGSYQCYCANAVGATTWN